MNYDEYLLTVKALNKMAKLYADGSEEAVTDSVYDTEYRKLKVYEEEHPNDISKDSPTQNVIDSASGFKKIKHEIPMISIQDSMGEEESQKWINKIVEKTKNDNFCIEYKIDGLGLDLKYQDGILIDAITRGNGQIGDSVLENAKMISTIPNKINKSGFFECRGEVVWEFEKFNQYNSSLKIPLKNPRNGASGALKRHDPTEVKKCNLTFIAYTVINGSSNVYQHEDLNLLSSLGFKVEPYNVVTAKTFHQFAEKMSSKRFELEFPIDGIVIKLNDKRLYKELGISGKCPNYYRAYKFPPEEAETILNSIELSIGSSGAITPVAIFDPIKLAGTTVKRCSLHNWDLVEYLGLYEKCHIIIRKAGEIIPEIVRCVNTGRTKDDYKVLKLSGSNTPIIFNPNTDSMNLKLNWYFRPKICPFCGNKLKQEKTQTGEDGVALICDNQDCQSQMANKITHFIGNSCLNIVGIGPAFIESLFDLKLIKTYSDLYRLTANDIVNNGLMREKHANEIIERIKNSKDNTLANLIAGFSIPTIGTKVANKIAKSIKSLINDFTIESLINDGISSIHANKFMNWVNSHKEECEFFTKNKIATKISENNISNDNILSNQVCIMTGTFDKLPRKDFKNIVEKLGGTICGSISKKTTIILLGENAGPNKIADIEKLKDTQHFKIYTNDNIQEFLTLIKYE